MRAAIDAILISCRSGYYAVMTEIEIEKCNYGHLKMQTMCSS
jgi:hypothetical protein